MTDCLRVLFVSGPQAVPQLNIPSRPSLDTLTPPMLFKIIISIYDAVKDEPFSTTSPGLTMTKHGTAKLTFLSDSCQCKASDEASFRL